MSRSGAPLPHHRRLRLQVLLFAVLVAGALSAGMHLAGLHLLALRWPLALAGGYVAALAVHWMARRGPRRHVDTDVPRSPGGGVECGDSGLELGDLSPPIPDRDEGRGDDRAPAGEADRGVVTAAALSWRPMLALIGIAALLGAVIDHGLPQAGSLPEAIRLLRG